MPNVLPICMAHIQPLTALLVSMICHCMDAGSFDLDSEFNIFIQIRNSSNKIIILKQFALIFRL